jgi:hypothetical protein
LPRGTGDSTALSKMQLEERLPATDLAERPMAHKL